MKILRLFLSACFILCHSLAPARDLTYVFTSKGVYETCEDLWFKCLVLDRESRRLSDASHTAYIELVNPADSVVCQEKYPVADGQSEGHIYVGDDWMPGEYRLYAYTRNSVGQNDTIQFPTRILVVNDLSEVPRQLAAHSSTVTIAPEHITPYNGGLKATVTLDSTSYGTRSSVNGQIRVTDNEGNPVEAKVVLSVYDCLYRYKHSEGGLSTRLYAEDNSGSGSEIQPFLSDGVSSGVMRKGRKGKELTESQWINVYDVDAAAGKFNIVETDPKGRFEVTSDIGLHLGRELIMKPLTAEKNHSLVFDRPFESLAELRDKSTDYSFPVIQSPKTDEGDEDYIDPVDSDYTSRKTVHLDEVVAQAKTPYYSHREKLYGYLDSIHAMKSGVWVCHCPSRTGNGYINDYIRGYSHHQDGYLMPKEKFAPKIGVAYEAIKYSCGTAYDHVVDIQIVVYEGERMSQEDLLKEAGLFADQGYERPHAFTNWNPDDWFVGMDDNRNTLLWFPRGETDENGTLELIFYTSDFTSTFIVRGIAFSEDGRFTDIGNVVFEVE